MVVQTSSRLARKYLPLATLKVYGPDSKGIVAASTELLNRFGCTIVASEHYTDRSQNMFFYRSMFEDANDVAGCYKLSAMPEMMHRNDSSRMVQEGELVDGLSNIAERFGVTCELDRMQRPKKVAVMVSKYDHCLWEILLRQRAHELKRCEVALVISNHLDCRPIAEDTFGIPFYHFPITAENKLEQEQKQLQLLKKYDIDLIVLARYMQVLSGDFLNEYTDRIINIHHSFLPAFKGGRAYHQAHDRGVKLIGATVRLFDDVLACQSEAHTGLVGSPGTLRYLRS